MQEKFYQELSFKELAQRIIEIGDMQALACLNSRVAKCNDTGEFLNDLDCLILYYIYYIWMPEDLRQDAQVFKEYLTKDEADIWYNISQDNDIIEEAEYSDMYQSFIRTLVQDITFRHSGGNIGKKRDISQFVFPILRNLNESNYQQISDYCLKILFIGGCLYNKEMFSSTLEANVFHSFLFKKKMLAYIEGNGNVPQEDSIESAVLELNLV